MRSLFSSSSYQCHLAQLHCHILGVLFARGSASRFSISTQLGSGVGISGLCRRWRSPKTRFRESAGLVKTASRGSAFVPHAAEKMRLGPDVFVSRAILSARHRRPLYRCGSSAAWDSRRYYSRGPAPETRRWGKRGIFMLARVTPGPNFEIAAANYAPSGCPHGHPPYIESNLLSSPANNNQNAWQPRA